MPDTTWYVRAWQHMTRIQAEAEPGANIGKAIDDSYPWWRKELRAAIEDLNACLDKVKELNK